MPPQNGVCEVIESSETLDGVRECCCGCRFGEWHGECPGVAAFGGEVRSALPSQVACNSRQLAKDARVASAEAASKVSQAAKACEKSNVNHENEKLLAAEKPLAKLKTKLENKFARKGKIAMECALRAQTTINDYVSDIETMRGAVGVPTTTTNTSTSSTTPSSATTTSTLPTCANGGIACGAVCGGTCPGVCVWGQSENCLYRHCGSDQRVCVKAVDVSNNCGSDGLCASGDVCATSNNSCPPIGLGGACDTTCAE
jgi:hypothetical protein